MAHELDENKRIDPVSVRRIMGPQPTLLEALALRNKVVGAIRPEFRQLDGE